MTEQHTRPMSHEKREKTEPCGAPLIHGPSKPDVVALLECFVDGLINSVAILAGGDDRTVAEMLERVSAATQEASEVGFSRARNKARARAAREEKA
jgi:hypothetical protein